MKSMRDYRAEKECGNLVKAQWVDDRILDLEIVDEDEEETYGVKPAALGAYFEFITFGNLPKGGIPPTVELGVRSKQMPKPYWLATRNSKRLLAYFERMGLKVIKSGWRVTKGRHEGTIDIVVECMKEIQFRSGIVWKVGDRLVIDLKYSGFLGNKGRWSKHGWQFNALQKEYHGTQAKQYHYITGLPFYFLVFSSKNEKDVKLFHVPVDGDMVEAHIAEGNYLYEVFIATTITGFVPRPEVGKCLKCPLWNECKDRAEYPDVEVIDLNDVE